MSMQGLNPIQHAQVSGDPTLIQNLYQAGVEMQLPNTPLDVPPATSNYHPDFSRFVRRLRPLDERLTRLKQHASKLDGCGHDNAEQLRLGKEEATRCRSDLTATVQRIDRGQEAGDVATTLEQWLREFKDAVDAFEATVARVATLMPADVTELYVEPGVFGTVEAALLDEQDTAALNVRGGAGFGKSALSRHLWNKTVQTGPLRHRFPDGVIHIEFNKGPDGEEEQHLLRKVHELESMLDKDAHEERANSDQQQLDGAARGAYLVKDELRHALLRVRRLLDDGKQRLVIFDDVWPEHACVLQTEGVLSRNFRGRCVVMSRANLVNSFEVEARAVPMQNEPAVCETILASYAYRAPDVRVLKLEHKEWGDRLLSKCGAQPLMIRLVGSLLHEEMERREGGQAPAVWRIVHDSLEKRLHDHQDDVAESVHNYSTHPMAAYALSLEQLDEDALRLLHLMTLFPHSRAVPAGAVLAVWHASTGAADGFSRHLRRLQKMSVVDVMPQRDPMGTDDVRMHALLHIYLKNRPDTAPATSLLPTMSSRQRTPYCCPLISWLLGSVAPSSTDSLISPTLAAHSVLLLYADGQPSTAPRPALQALVRHMGGAVPSDWWNQSSTFECNPDSVVRVHQLAHELELDDLAAACRQLMLSAATQHVWADLQAVVAHLMRDLTTAPVALAVAAGSMPSLRSWPRAYTASLTAMAKVSSDSEDSLRALGDIAEVLCNLGRFTDALKIGELVLAERKKRLGAQHSDTLTSMTKVASYLHRLGRSNKALAMGQESLEIRQTSLGAKHPDTLTSMHGVARYLSAVDRNEEALAMVQRVLGVQQTSLGAEHPDTVKSMNNVAVYLHRLGRTQEALDMTFEVSRILLNSLGAEHPNTLNSTHNVAVYLHCLGRTQEALDMAQDVLRIQQASLGAEHPDTLTTMRNVAMFSRKLGRRERKRLEVKWRGGPWPQFELSLPEDPDSPVRSL